MPIRFTNLAYKVDDLDEAIRFYESCGAEISNRMEWAGSERADVRLGDLALTLFTRAIYDDEIPVGQGFLHVAVLCDDLDRQLEGHDVVFGPLEVKGPFGHRRIAFVNAPGGTRLEFMQQLDQG